LKTLARKAGRITVSPGPITASGDLKKVRSGPGGSSGTPSLKLRRPHSTLPGRGTGARSLTCASGIAVPFDCASCSAPRSWSNSLISVSSMYCGGAPGKVRTSSEISTTPSCLTRQGRNSS
jgi:hypothetical protein